MPGKYRRVLTRLRQRSRLRRVTRPQRDCVLARPAPR